MQGVSAAWMGLTLGREHLGFGFCSRPCAQRGVTVTDELKEPLPKVLPEGGSGKPLPVCHRIPATAGWHIQKSSFESRKQGGRLPLGQPLEEVHGGYWEVPQGREVIQVNDGEELHVSQSSDTSDETIDPPPGRGDQPIRLGTFEIDNGREKPDPRLPGKAGYRWGFRPLEVGHFNQCDCPRFEELVGVEGLPQAGEDIPKLPQVWGGDQEMIREGSSTDPTTIATLPRYSDGIEPYDTGRGTRSGVVGQ